jgi:hypothetical protein
VTPARITDADREAAHAALVDHFGPEGSMWVLLRSRVAQAIADAREAGRQSGLEEGENIIGDLAPGVSELLAKLKDAIAARRAR